MNKLIQKPSFFLFITEFPRALFELIKGIFFVRSFKPINKGANQVVMVIPGFLLTFFTTSLIRKFLQKMGYTTYGWGLGQNLGNVEDLAFLSKRLADISEKHQQKIILIGWSLGGVYARELAKENPNAVKQLLTLGSPFMALDAPNYALFIFNMINSMENIDKKWFATLPIPAQVPTKSFYSKRDGIVPWAACIETPDNLHQNYEMPCSHLGYCANPVVFRALQNEIN